MCSHVSCDAHCARALLCLTLKAVSLLQVTESFHAAGCVSQLLFARIDALRFATIYSAKGHWGLLDQLLLTAEPSGTTSRRSNPPYASSTAVHLLSGGERDLIQPGHMSATDLQAVVHVVKNAAAEILGQELDGGCGIVDHLPPWQPFLLHSTLACLRGHLQKATTLRPADLTALLL